MATSSQDTILPVLSNFDAFVHQVGAKQLVIFLDYDGTLTPIVSRPEDAVIPPKTREAIKRLSRKYVTAIVSGRAKENVHELVGVDNLIYAGSHGFNIEGPNMQHQVATEYIPTLTEIAHILEQKLCHIPGFIMENNQFSLSAHYRMVETEEGRKTIEQTVRDVVDSPQYRDKARITNGSCVYEIRPKFEWHKGKAVEFLIDFFSKRGIILPNPRQDSFSIFIGDDRTDEDAFRSLHDNGLGAGILVATESDSRLHNTSSSGSGDGATAASYFIPNTELVCEFLDRLANADINTTKYTVASATTTPVASKSKSADAEATVHTEIDTTIRNEITV